MIVYAHMAFVTYSFIELGDVDIFPAEPVYYDTEIPIWNPEVFTSEIWDTDRIDDY